MHVLRPLRALVLLPLLLAAACLEFDAQEVVLHYDAKTDRLDVLLLYKGMFLEGDSEASVKESMEQLETARRTGLFAFWSNWPLKADLTKVKGPLAALASHVEVENGGLFTDPGGTLNAYQFLRVNDVKGFLGKLNTLIALGIRTQVLDRQLHPGNHELDDETKDLLTDVLRGREAVLTLDGTTLRARIPCSDRDSRWLKQYVAQRFLTTYRSELYQLRVRQMERENLIPPPKEGEPEGVVDPDDVLFPFPDFDTMSESSPTWRFFWDNDISFERKEGLTVVTLGLPHVAENRIHKASMGSYQENLLDLLRERKEKLEDAVPFEEIERRFAAFHDRDADLPPALAELRAK